MSDELPLSRPFAPSAVGAGAVDIAVTTTSDERAAIARNLGLLELTELEAWLTIDRDAGGRGLVLTGALEATVVQSCVVSLKPVVQRIDEAFVRRFVPAPGAVDVEASVDVDPSADDPPDSYDAGGIDLGVVVLEQLILAVDPYPRAEDAELPADASAGNDKTESPFAVLKSLGQRQ